MDYILKLRDDRLYWCWAGLFVLTGALSLLAPEAEGFGRALLLMLTAGFFLPPWLILTKAKKTGDRRNVRIIRYLALASLAATTGLFCAGIYSLGAGQGMGNAIHVLMAIVCAPLMCGNYYALPMFLWATLLFGSFAKNK